MQTMNKSNIYKLFIYFISFCGIFYANESKAQSDSASLQTFIRGQAGYSIFYHKPDFYDLPGAPSCCPHYGEESKGSGAYFGLTYELSLLERLLLGLRVNFNYFNSEFNVREKTDIRIGDEIKPGFFIHNLKTDMTTLEFESYLRFYLFDNFSIWGGGFVAPFLTKSYEQYEKIESPKGAVFSDTKTKTRNQKSGNFDGSVKGIWGGLTGGVGYDLPLNKSKSWFITPEISYNLGLTDIVDSISWKANALKFGVSISYAPKPEIIPEILNKKIVKIDTITINESEYLYDTFKAGKSDTNLYVEKIDNKIINYTKINQTDTIYKKRIYTVNINPSAPTIQIKTKLVTQAFQNLDAVFFENSSNKLQSNYNMLRVSSQFDINGIEPLPINLHNNMLNIVGYRMRQYPKTTIHLKGFIDSTTENKNLALAYSRAQTIKDYLSTVWQIDSARILIKYDKNCYPALQTLTKNDSGFAENRRVQIIPDNPEILAPLKRENFEEIVEVAPREFQISTSGTDPRGINSWEIDGYQDKYLAFKFSGEKMPEKITATISDSMARSLNSSLPLDIMFVVNAANGAKAFANKTLEIKKDTSDIKVSRLALILFDVASDKIPSAAVPEIKEFLKTLKPDSKIRVLGYSDVLGGEEFNMKLSINRATAAAELIKKLHKNVNIIEAKGLGCSEFPPGINSYNTCAERFLSRTVLIEIIDKAK
jgi:outer membrane protein OmpA-like peptidoglycan-associated protein